MNASINRPILVWSALGLAAFLLLPWYALPDGLLSLQGFGELVGGHDSSSAIAQVFLHRRPWLIPGAVALLAGLLAVSMAPTRRQGIVLFSAGAIGTAAVLVQGFAIGLAPAGSTSLSQPGFGWGAVVVLLALLMVTACGVARMGAFRGDLFVAGAVVLSGALLVIFVAYPVLRSLSSALIDESGRLNLTLAYRRIANEHIWGFGCLTGGGRCGVAWNTLLLAVLTGAGTTF
jgi:iron(III) transport system permease protein